ncbi:MAG: hypothetical protein MUC96_19830 [Myxococcaceae bacterium]|jgi:uncharacterized protein YjeT (DUF2065 family)|nr:hypothetical protein [Myxococcaceae bacterium]
MMHSLVVVALLAGLPGEAEGEAGYTDFFARGEAMAAKNEDAVAIALWREAEAFKGTPQSAQRLARAYEKLGDGAFATLYYRLALARAPESAEAPTMAQSVGTLLGKAGSEGKGLIEVFAPRASKLVVQGREFPPGPVAMFAAPGEYEVLATFPGGVKSTRVRVKGGQVASLHFEPVQPPLVTVDQALPEAAIARGALNDEGPPPNVLRIASIIAMGLGVAAAGGGIGLGVSSSQDAAQAQNTMIPRAQRQQFADSANAKAVPANTLMIAGAAAVLAGGVMFFFSLPEPGTKK